MASYLRMGAFLFAAILSIASISVPVRAENPTAALTEASKMMDKGLPVKAIELIDAALASGKLPAESSAKALLMRAQAQEKLGKLAFALADYNSALWMEGLSAADKAQAEKGRDRISGKLGVSDGSKPAQASVATENIGARTPTSAPLDAKIQTTPSEERTGGIGSIFSGIFGSSKAAAETKQEDPAPPVAPPAKTPALAKPAVSTPAKPVSTSAKQAWAPKQQTAQLKAEKSARVAATERSQPAAPPPAGDASGKFGIQFAALHSEDSAISEVQRIAKKFGSELGGRSPAVKIIATSDGGTLYKIVAEGYERGEATAICELLKAKNLSCMVVSASR